MVSFLLVLEKTLTEKKIYEKIEEKVSQQKHSGTLNSIFLLLRNNRIKEIIINKSLNTAWVCHLLSLE